MKGRRKLHAEIDLLNIIKQLRINTFAMHSLLKPHQRQLVRWFDEYKLQIYSDESDGKNDDKKYFETAELEPESLDKQVDDQQDTDELMENLNVLHLEPHDASGRRYTVYEDQNAYINPRQK